MATLAAIETATTPVPETNDLTHTSFSTRLLISESSLPLFIICLSRYRHGTSASAVAPLSSGRHSVSICPASRADAFQKRL